MRIAAWSLAAFTAIIQPTSASGTLEASHASALPKGFQMRTFASGFSQPTAMAVGPDHRLYVAQQNGAIVVVSRTGLKTIATGYAVPLGLAWHARKLYVSWTGTVSVLTPSANFTRFSSRIVSSGIPTGKHQNDGIAFRGKWLYLGVGSTCNACSEMSAKSATILRMHPSGSHMQIFARGLRNPFGLAIQPRTHVLYATDNGRDDFDDSVPDELNRVVRRGRYGWPSCWGKRRGSHCAGTLSPVAIFEPHCSADGLVFYHGNQFPLRYRHDAFVAEWGDSVNALGTGHIVKAIHFGSHGVTTSTFATGFSHPLAVAVSSNGSLLVADWGTGIVWRIVYSE